MRIPRFAIQFNSTTQIYLFSTLQSAASYHQVCFGPDQINVRLTVSHAKPGAVIYTVCDICVCVYTHTHTRARARALDMHSIHIYLCVCLCVYIYSRCHYATKMSCFVCIRSLNKCKSKVDLATLKKLYYCASQKLPR